MTLAMVHRMDTLLSKGVFVGVVCLLRPKAELCSAHWKFFESEAGSCPLFKGEHLNSRCKVILVLLVSVFHRQRFGIHTLVGLSLS